MNDFLTLSVSETSDGERLDVFLSENLKDVSRSRAKALIDSGKVELNGKIVKPSKGIAEGDEVRVLLEEPVFPDILPEDIPFDIVFEDEFFAVINKPQGIVVHPTIQTPSGTLVNGLLLRLDNLSGINGVLRPGIVHRIDKDTSGLLVVAKCDSAHQSLAKQIAEKTCRRSYLALCEGVFKADSGRIETKIGRNPKDRKSMAVTWNGKDAITDYLVLRRFSAFTFVRFDLFTGRTHQIRVHAKYMGHPVVGDRTYGFLKQKFKLSGQLLHAETLSLDHPRTGERMTFTCPIPDYFQNVLDMIEAEENGANEE